MARKASTSTPQNVNADAIAACFTEYSSMMSDLQRLKYKMGTMFDRYEKSDGVDKKAIKNTYALSAKDPAEAAAQHKRNTEYAYITGVLKTDANGQVSLDDTVIPTVVPRPSKEMQKQINVARAFNDGYNSGLSGGLITACPFLQDAKGSDQFVSWRDGWSDGYADRIARNPEKAQQTVAEPRGEIDQTDLEEAIVEAVEKDRIGPTAGSA